jgi:protease II
LAPERRGSITRETRTVHPTSNIDFDTMVLCLLNQCITPVLIIDFNMKRKVKEIKKEQEVLAAFDVQLSIEERTAT